MWHGGKNNERLKVSLLQHILYTWLAFPQHILYTWLAFPSIQMHYIIQKKGKNNENSKYQNIPNQCIPSSPLDPHTASGVDEVNPGKDLEALEVQRILQTNS